MNDISFRKAKRTSLYGALFLIAPLVLGVYEQLAQHNGHPSLIKMLSELIKKAPSEPQQQKSAMPKKVASKKMTKPILKKIDIKASYQTEQKNDADQVKKDHFASLQKKKPTVISPLSKPEKENKILAIGNHLKGKVELPNLRLEGHLSEQLLYLLIKNQQAKIIVNGLQYYEVTGNSLWQGEFKTLTETELETLSNRNFKLSDSLVSKLEARYLLASFNNTWKASYKLRLTRLLSHQLAKEQRAAQAKIKVPLEETIFIMAIKEGRASFTIKPPNVP